jgi:hypothetical protein
VWVKQSVPNLANGALLDEIMAGSFGGNLDGYCQQGQCGGVAVGFLMKKIGFEYVKISDYRRLS